MSDPAADSADAFWSFSFDVYGRPGVAEACLALQDRHDLDVNLLLFACWAGSRGRSLSPAEWDGLIAATRDWQTQVVVPLRGLRRWLKGREATASGGAGALRAQIKTQELEAERIEQTLLAETLPLSSGAPDAAAAAKNLAGYLAAGGIAPDRAERDDCTLLLAGAFEELAAELAQRLVAGAMTP